MASSASSPTATVSAPRVIRLRLWPKAYEPGDGHQQGEGDAEGQGPDAAAGAENPEQHGDGQHGADEQVAAQVRADQMHQMPLAVGAHPVRSGREADPRLCRRVLATARVTGRVEAPGCLKTVRAMLGRPSRVTALWMGSGARTMRARARSGIGPAGPATGISSRSATCVGQAARLDEDVLMPLASDSRRGRAAPVPGWPRTMAVTGTS